jgi:hypothetical protein
MKKQHHKKVSVVQSRTSTGIRRLSVYTFRASSEDGVTLVELMIAVVIGMIIMGAIYGSFISQQRSYTAQDQVAEMNSTSKISLDMLVNDIRDTGFGVPDGLSTIIRTSGCQGINGFIDSITWDDSSTSDDSITLLGGFRRIGTVATEFSSGDATLALTATDLLKEGSTFQPDRGYISIGGVSFAMVTSISGNTLTLSASTPVDKSFPAGVPVYLVENVTYEVVNGQLQRVKRMDGSGSSCGTTSETDVLSENIEDFQIAYGYDSDDNGIIDPDTEFFNEPPAIDRLLRIRLNLLATTARPDPNFQGQGNPPALIENRAHAPTDDSLRRRLWRMEVAWRNRLL